MAMARSKSARKAVANEKPVGSNRRTRRIPRALDEAIEAERSVLMKADAVLNCLALAMDYDDGSNIPRPYYAIIVELARDLVNDSIGRLETGSLEAHLSLPGRGRAK